MEASFESVLIEALDALEAGDKVEAILARYAEHQVELRPILLTASKLTNVRVAHSLEGQAASRQRFLDYAAATAAPARQRKSMFVFLRRFALATAALLIVFTLLGTGVLFASSEAVPGDALYQAKRFFEDTRFALTGDTAAREELQQSFEGTRLREGRTLLRMGRSEEVTFMGTIESMEGNTWQVAGIKVVILDSTSISGETEAEVGDLVQISGLTADGRVDARSVIIHKLGDSLPQATPDPGSDDPAESRPSPTNTATSTPTATHTPTPTATPTEEATPTPSATPTPQPPENSNANSNENGGGNDNERNGNDNDNDGDDNENDRNENSGDNGNDSGNSNDNDHDNDNGHDNENDHDNDNENHNVNEEENVNNGNINA